jgi:hypothetical protein
VDSPRQAVVYAHGKRSAYGLRLHFARAPARRLSCFVNSESKNTTMRTTLFVVGVLLMLVGTVWFFQGINVLPGSFMTGQTQWAVYGAIAFLIGIFAFYQARRISRKSQRQ